VDLHDLFEILVRIASGLFGLAVGIAAFCFVWMRSAERWRVIARIYPAPQLSEPVTKLNLETIILHSGGIGFNHFGGIVTARLHTSGVALSLLPGFSVAHPPIFFPYNEISLAPYSWYVIGKTAELKTSRSLNGVTIIIHDTLADALERQGVRTSRPKPNPAIVT
jgi:hypothetical protein